MTREEHLKYCSVCVNRKVGPNHETICRLTNAKADFDPTCPSYQFDNKPAQPQYARESSMGIGKAIFYVVLAIVAFARIATTIYKSNNNNRRDEYSQFNNILEESQRQREREQNRDQLGQLSDVEKEELGIKKASKDSTIVIDKFIDYTLLKNEYIMSSLMDEDIKLMARDKKNFSFVIHKFDKSDDVISDWEKLRILAGSKISPTQIAYKVLNENTFTYNVKNSFSLIHGKARYYVSGKNCYVFQYESSSKQNEITVDIGFDQVVKDHIQLKK